MQLWKHPLQGLAVFKASLYVRVCVSCSLLKICMTSSLLGLGMGGMEAKKENNLEHVKCEWVCERVCKHETS